MRGWKLWFGTIGYMLCEGAKTLFPQYGDSLHLLQQLFMAFGVVGIGHKLDKSAVRP